jgi:hypothetical protein
LSSGDANATRSRARMVGVVPVGHALAGPTARARREAAEAPMLFRYPSGFDRLGARAVFVPAPPPNRVCAA